MPHCTCFWKNLSSFFQKKSEIKDFANRNLYEKSKSKAFEILLKCEKIKEGVKMFLQKDLKKTLMKIKKVFY